MEYEEVSSNDIEIIPDSNTRDARNRSPQQGIINKFQKLLTSTNHFHNKRSIIVKFNNNNDNNNISTNNNNNNSNNDNEKLDMMMTVRTTVESCTMKKKSIEIDMHDEIQITDNLLKRHKEQKKYQCCKYFIWKPPWILIVTSMIQLFIMYLDDVNIYNNLLYSPFKKKQIWRFITYSFLHSGYIHIFMNIFIQILVAIPLEMEQGHFKVFIVYFGGSISGALSASIFQPTLLMIGASAGVYSLLISHLSHTALNFTTLSYRYSRLLCVFVLTISDIMFVMHHYSHNLEPKISIAAHIGGALAGLILGFMIYTRSSLAQSNTIIQLIFRIIRYCSIVIFIFFIIISISYTID